MDAAELLALVIRDAEQRGLPDETVFSIGWWAPMTAVDLPQFHPQLRLTLGEIRTAAASRPSAPDPAGDRARREAAGLGLAHVAVSAGCSTATVRSYEMGAPTRMNIVRKLRAVYDGLPPVPGEAHQKETP